jgi:hypothetical protein
MANKQPHWPEAPKSKTSATRPIVPAVKRTVAIE